MYSKTGQENKTQLPSLPQLPESYTSAAGREWEVQSDLISEANGVYPRPRKKMEDDQSLQNQIKSHSPGFGHES
jgi:hypothetical protein